MTITVSLKPEYFEGLRFDVSKALNKKFALSNRYSCDIHKDFFNPTYTKNTSNFSTNNSHLTLLMLNPSCTTLMLYRVLLKELPKLVCSLFMGSIDMPGGVTDPVVKQASAHFELGANLIDEKVHMLPRNK